MKGSRLVVIGILCDISNLISSLSMSMDILRAVFYLSYAKPNDDMLR